MPIYEYKCECGKGEDIFLPYSRFEEEQVCKCGKVMPRKMSASSFVMKQTGNQMALDALNDKHNGMPDRHWKADAEKLAARGL